MTLTASPTKAASRSFMDNELSWLARPVLGVAAVLALLPIVHLASAALVRGGSLDLSAAFAPLTSKSALQATINSIEIGLASGVVALLLGTIVALALATTDVPGKRVAAFLFVWSLMIAPHVAALAFKTLLGPASPLLGALGLAPPPGSPNPLVGKLGIILVLGLHHAPLAAITIAPSLAALPHAVIEAARVDGARSPTILMAIILPLLAPSLCAAALLCFAAGIGNFGIPALLGIPAGVLTLPTLIYRQLSSSGPSIIADAAALSILIGCLAGACAWLASRLGRNPTGLSQDRPLEPFVRLGRLRWPAAAALWSLIAIAAIIPFLSLIGTSLLPAYGMKLSLATLTPEAYIEVLGRQQLTRRAFRNSFLIAAAAALILAAGAVILAYAMRRRPRWWTPALETAVELPYVVPGVVLAIACILIFLKPLPLIGVSLYATPWIILFAYLARFLAVALKPVRAALATLSLDAEEAAAVDGARLRDRLVLIVFPAVMPAAFASALLVFLLAFNELTVSALLWSAGSETLGVALLSLDDAGLATEAAALGVTTALIVALIMFVLDRISAQLSPGALPWGSLAR